MSSHDISFILLINKITFLWEVILLITHEQTRVESSTSWHDSRHQPPS